MDNCMLCDAPHPYPPECELCGECRKLDKMTEKKQPFTSISGDKTLDVRSDENGFYFHFQMHNDLSERRVSGEYIISIDEANYLINAHKFLVSAETYVGLNRIKVYPRDIEFQGDWNDYCDYIHLGEYPMKRLLAWLGDKVQHEPLHIGDS